MMSLPVWEPRPMFLLGGLCPGHLCPGGSLSIEVSVRGSLSREVSVGRRTGLKKAGSTHPTGMLSCLQLKYLVIARI